MALTPPGSSARTSLSVWRLDPCPSSMRGRSAGVAAEELHHQRRDLILAVVHCDYVTAAGHPMAFDRPPKAGKCLESTVGGNAVVLPGVDHQRRLRNERQGRVPRIRGLHDPRSGPARERAEGATLQRCGAVVYQRLAPP